MEHLERSFFARDCLIVASELVGKILVHKTPDGEIRRARITETEAYCGVQDTACHAHKGMTERNKLLWYAPGTIYIYLCYGMHNLLNIITGQEGQPQGVLIRACENFTGPGKLTKHLGITLEQNGQSVLTSTEIWIEDDALRPEILTDKRVGIGYASQEDQDRLWRFKMK